MKYCLGVGMWLLVFCAAAQQTEVWSRVDIRTSLPVKEYLETPWRNSMSEETAMNFLQPLIHLIDSGVITVCRPEAPFNFPLSKIEIHALLHQYDTMNAENYETGMWDTVIVRRDLHWDEIKSFDFQEKWELDPVNGVFTKKVIGVIFRKKKISKITGEYLGDVPLFYLAFNMNSIKDPARLKRSDCHLYHIPETPLHLIDPGNGERQNMNKMHSMLTPFLVSAPAAFDTTYPYTTKLPGKKLKELAEGRSAISDYLLREYWILNPGTFAFEKSVVSLIFQKRYLNRTSAYAVIHLNKYQPRPLLQNEKRYPNAEFQQSQLFENVPLSVEQYWYPVGKADSTAVDHFFREVGEKVLKGKIPSYATFLRGQPFTPDHSESFRMDSAQREHAFITRDTAWLEGAGSMEPYVMTHSFLDEYPIGMISNEQWSLDPGEGIFHKHVSYFGATYTFREYPRSEPYKVVSKYVINNNSLSPGAPVLLGKNLKSYAYLDLWLDHPIEDTIMLVPLLKTPNNLGTMEKYQLIQGLIHACTQGKLSAMDPVTGKILKKNEVLTFLHGRMDSLSSSGHLQPEFKAVDHLEFEENWYRHEGTTDISKEVLAVTLIDMRARAKEDRIFYEPQPLLKIVFKTPKK